MQQEIMAHRAILENQTNQASYQRKNLWGNVSISFVWDKDKGTLVEAYNRHNPKYIYMQFLS